VATRRADGERVRYNEIFSRDSMRQNFSALINATPFAFAAASVLARRRWSFVAGACLFASAVLWLVRGADAAFVAATLGIVAWFWDQRNRLRSQIIEPDDAADEAREEIEEDDVDDEFDDMDDNDGNDEDDDNGATDHIGARDADDDVRARRV
jgi:hypothetical protein